jgi:RNA polymerase-binding transcription factor DksA
VRPDTARKLLLKGRPVGGHAMPVYEEEAIMNRNEIADYRQSLLDLRERLEGDWTQLKDEALRPMGGEASGGLSNIPLHLADLGSHGFEEELTLGLLESTEETVREINAALARMERGVFGICQGCGRPIRRGRLKALPYTPYCLSCAGQRQEESLF